MHTSCNSQYFFLLIIFSKWCMHTSCNSQSFFLLIVFSKWCLTFSVTHGLFSLSISLVNNVFTLPIAHGPFLLSNIFTQQSILQKQKLDSASKKMTKSWSHILPIHNAEIKFYLHAVVGHHSTFSFIISETCFFIQLVMKMKGKVLIYNPLYAQSLWHEL